MTGSVARRWALDGALAAASAYAAGLLTIEIIEGLPSVARPAALVLAVVYGAALLFRRAAPRTVLAVQGAAAVGYAALGLPVPMLGAAVLVTLYTVGSRLERRAGLVALASAEALLAVLVLARPDRPDVGSWVLFSVLLAAAWFLGDIVRRWQVAAVAHARRAVELEQAREELARLAVADERLRIARELHDVVAHTMTVIAMHAGSGRLAADRDPAAARKALEVVEESSRHALAELRRLVTVLRDADDREPVHEPAPGLPDLHRLVAEVAAAGVAVDVHTEGDMAQVPEGVSLAAYRIVQEALTNVVRHAGATRARLSVAVREDQVRLEVDDDGSGRDGRRPEPGDRGYGLVGMRERAALYGGEVTAGPGPGGNWHVAGWLPYAGTRP
jgi:signal transduction histidine kinase